MRNEASYRCRFSSYPDPQGSFKCCRQYQEASDHHSSHFISQNAQDSRQDSCYPRPIVVHTEAQRAHTSLTCGSKTCRSLLPSRSRAHPCLELPHCAQTGPAGENNEVHLAAFSHPQGLPTLFNRFCHQGDHTPYFCFHRRHARF